MAVTYRRPRYPRPRLGGFGGGGYGYPELRIPGLGSRPPVLGNYPGTYQGAPSWPSPFGSRPPVSGNYPGTYPGSPPIPPLPGIPNPYAPKTDAQLQAEAAAFVGAQINPLIDEINRSITARSQSGSQAIQSATAALINAMAGYGPATAAAYGTAEKNVAALEDALANRLTGQGKDVAADLSGALAAAGQDTTGAQGLAGVGAAAANAGLAQGSAALEALISQGAAAQNYGAKLPTIGGLYGREATNQFQSMLNQQLAEQLGQVRSQVPGLTANIFESLQGREFAKAEASRQERESARGFREGVREFDVGRAESRRQFDVSRQPTPYQVRQEKIARFAQMKRDKEADTGIQWEVTSTGVRPRKVNGQTVPTRQGRIDLDTERHNREVDTGYQQVIRNGKVVPALVNGRRVPTQASSDKTYAKAAALAADRTRNTPWVWEVTPDGRVVRRVGSDGKPMLNPRTKANQVTLEANRVAQREQKIRTWQEQARFKSAQPVLGKDGKYHLYEWEVAYKGTGPRSVPIGVRPKRDAKGNKIEIAAPPGEPPKVNPSTSKLLHYLVDEHGQPILDASGKRIPIPQAAKGTTVPQASSGLSRLFGVLTDVNGNPILRGGKTVPVPRTSPTAAKPNLRLSQAQHRWVDANGNPIKVPPGTPPPPPFYKPPKPTTAPEPDLSLSIARKKWVDSSGREIPGSKEWGPPPPKYKPTAPAGSAPPTPIFGTAPRRNNQGVWINRQGKRLSPAGQKYWQGLFDRGLTDGAGHITRPSKSQQHPKEPPSSSKPPWVH
jgi:hypothetical protein